MHIRNTVSTYLYFLYVRQEDTKPIAICNTKRYKTKTQYLNVNLDCFFILDIRYLTLAMKLATYWIFACWANIVDGGPTLAQHRINIGPTYFAGWVCIVSIRL